MLFNVQMNLVQGKNFIPVIGFEIQSRVMRYGFSSYRGHAWQSITSSISSHKFMFHVSRPIAKIELQVCNK